ncbi:MAG: SANT/Myb-like DNA-binding domain-containing protein [Candidatus Sulfotelmatobacter sp.]
MENSETLRIVRALADGVNPVTGETLAAESVFQQPQTIRALERAAAALETCSDTQDKNSLPEIEHIRLVDPTQPWGAEEDERLYMEFYRSIDFEIIAQRLGRSKNAVISRLMKLAKKKPRAAKAA